jgi:hypothetical protein
MTVQPHTGSNATKLQQLSQIVGLEPCRSNRFEH